jgi:DNA-binding protein YbaB
MSQQTTDPGGPGPFSGTDRGGLVTVVLDDRRRVDQIRVASLPDDLREPGGLAGVLDEAYRAAVATAVDFAAERAGRPRRPGTRRPVATDEPARPRPSFGRSWGHASDEDVMAFRRRTRSRSPESPRPGRGVSRNECVEVVLHATDHFGDITVDPGWLRNASAESVQRALGEAFDRANGKGV